MCLVENVVNFCELVKKKIDDDYQNLQSGESIKIWHNGMKTTQKKQFPIVVKIRGLVCLLSYYQIIIQHTRVIHTQTHTQK